MKLFETKNGIVLEKNGSQFHLENEDWDNFLNDDNLHSKMEEIITNSTPDSGGTDLIDTQLEAPVQNQEVWASGVTYYNSKLAREAESKDSGGGQFYANVYMAARPELFFKASAYRTVGPGGEVRIRKDSSWDVPEPELTLAVTSSGTIVGYTIGNDMSSRSIEGSVRINQMKRKPEELVSYLFRKCSFPAGCFLMTGTGIVPSPDFTLQPKDEIRITIEPIGTLVNRVG